MSERLYAGQVLSGYRLEGSAGRGGFGMVLKASRITDGKTVALKVLRPKHHGDLRREKQLLNEGKILRTLDHPRILRCLDVGRAGAWSFLVLPWVDGQPLSQHLAGGGLKPELALDCAFQILEALDYVHRKGMIHQDVKPGNILINSRGKCFLFDFGLAVTRTDALKLRAAGGTQRSVGTGSFQAPEQSIRGASVGRSADIYSFGVSLHQMLTGALPQGGVLSSALSAEVADIVTSCLAEDPKARPSAQALRQKLHGLESPPLSS